jgi:HEAT repeat protein
MSKKLTMLLMLAVLSAAGWLSYERGQPQPRYQGRVITEWIRDLAAEDYQVRDAAGQAVQAVGLEAVPYLIDALRSREWRFTKTFRAWASKIPFVRFEPTNVSLGREQAAEHLGAISAKTHTALPALIAALRESDLEVLAEVQRALRRTGMPAVPLLADALRRGNAEVRRGAAEVLRDFGPQAGSAVPALRQALRDRDASVRQRAAQALGSCAIGDSATTQRLVESLSDPAPAVRCAAADALGFLQTADAIPVLSTVLHDEDAVVRVAVARALWEIQRQPGLILPVLCEAVRDADAGWQAIFLLGEIGPKAALAVPALIVALKQEKVPRPLRMPPSTAMALGKIGVAAVPELIECLRDSQPRTRTSAAIALGFIGTKAKAAVPAMAALLHDADQEDQQAVALSLGEIDLHAKDLPPVLAALTRDDDILVSATAASLLRKIDPDAATPASE